MIMQKFLICMCNEHVDVHAYTWVQTILLCPNNIHNYDNYYWYNSGGEHIYAKAQEQFL